MSVASEITRLQNAKAALKTAINAKNDSSHQIDDETLEDYAGFVDNISTSEGGGGGTVQEAESKDVNFYDYDGKILYSYTASEFAQLTEMPANPTHTGLTSKGWNWTLANAKTQVTATGKCDIGQMYRVTDGKTRLYCHFDDGTKSFYFGLCPKGTVTIDWGDGSTNSTLTGTSATTLEEVQHSYATAGDYVITLSLTSGTVYSINGASYGTYLFRKTNSNTQYINYANAACLKKAEIGEKARILNYGFWNCSNLESIVISDNIDSTSIANQTFNNCHNLRHITIPTNQTTFGNYVFRNCYSLTSISLPKEVTTFGSYVFYAAYALKRIVFSPSITAFGGNCSLYNCYALVEPILPTSLTAVKQQTFYQCYSLPKLVVPASVTSIETKAFQNCYGMKEYHFKSTTPPTLDNTDAFSNIQSDCVIYVPSAKLNNYKTASNWSTYASQMVGE